MSRQVAGRLRFSLTARLLLAGLLTLVLPGSARAAERRTPVVEAVEKAAPAVVNISTAQVVEQRGPFGGVRPPGFEEFFRDFVEPRRERITRASLGSGVIIRPDGYILTNQHVVLQGNRIHVTLADEREFEATLVGADSDSDLAVLKVNHPEPLPHLELEGVDDLLIGETVIAIGNPFGLSHTVTTGVISAVGRSLQADDHTYYDFIQTDASINPGNSGGPLLNLDGKLVGINTAIYQKAQGIGFAVPVSRARRIVTDLISYGEVQLPWIGAIVQQLTPDLASHFGARGRRGVLVRGIENGSPARDAGLQRGDIIVAVDGRPVRSSDEYEQRVRDHAAEGEITFTIVREGAERALRLRASQFPAERADALAWDLLGIRVQDARGAVMVAQVRRESNAARIGVEVGDLVVGVGGVVVRNHDAFRKKLIEFRLANSVLISIQRARRIYNVPMPLGDRG